MKRINLIKKPKEYLKYENFFLFLRKTTFFLTIFFLIIFIPSYLFIYQKDKDLKSLYQKKGQLLNFLTKNKEKEVIFLNLKGKHQLLIDFLKDDVNFLPYYSLLLESLKFASETPMIDKVVIDNKKRVEFYLSFKDINSFLSFLKYAESEDFVNKFNKLYISRIDLTEESKQAKLLFIGEFKSFLDL